MSFRSRIKTSDLNPYSCLIKNGFHLTSRVFKWYIFENWTTIEFQLVLCCWITGPVNQCFRVVQLPFCPNKYSIHPKAGLSGFQMAISRTLLDTNVKNKMADTI
jgi:hypothetical protein